MNIKDKLYMDYDGLVKNGPITIVAFGDSVTHGALALDEINYETVYWNLLKKKINAVRNYMPVNVINAGIGGITAIKSVDRVQRDVLSHNPDLVIVCFGLNDVNHPVEEYTDALRKIFEKCLSAGADVIFMTPNMFNTYVADDTADIFKEYAATTAEYQNSGKMDLYMREAIKTAKESGVSVCDCYSEWKKLSKTEDTTMMLANRINHPTKEMHKLFADMLFDIIFDGKADLGAESESTMYKG